MTPKYECRVCKAATECTEIWKNENEEFMNCSAFVAPPPTNADRIRAMSDRELARLLCDFKGDCHECPAYSYCEHGHNGMLYWLKEEVKE